MINDPAVLTSVQQQWAALKRLCAGSHRQYLVPGDGFINETPPESFYNLPFLLAFAVLDQVLDELIAEGVVPRPKTRRSFLGDKMIASTPALSWQDYSRVDAGRLRRNELAHDARLLDRADCLAFVAAIESELTAWRVL